MSLLNAIIYSGSRKNDRHREFYRAKRLFGDKITNRVSKFIDDLCGNTDRSFYEFKLFEKALYGNKWANYAMYYMIDHKAKLVKAHSDERKFVNSIGILAGFGEIYKGSGVLDITKYDCSKGYISRHQAMIIDLDHICKTISDPEYNSKMILRKIELGIPVETNNTEIKNDNPQIINNGGSQFTVDDQGKMHPIYFYENNQKPILQNDEQEISKEEIKKIEEDLGDVVGKYKRRYTKTNDGLVRMYVRRDNGIGTNFEEQYIIDTGSVMGGKHASVFAPYINELGIMDYMFISYKRKPTLEKLMLSSLTPLEYKDINNGRPLLDHNRYNCNDDYFNHQIIYRYIDMSRTDWFDNLSDTDKEIVDMKLNFVINVIKSGIQRDRSIDMDDCPRFRFEYFKDINDFGIISDKVVKSPNIFVDMGVVSTNTLDGLRVNIKDDMMTQINGNLRHVTRIVRIPDGYTDPTNFI